MVSKDLLGDWQVFAIFAANLLFFERAAVPLDTENGLVSFLARSWILKSLGVDIFASSK